MVDRLYSKRVSRPLLGREVIKKDAKNSSVCISIIHPLRSDGRVKELDVDQFSGQKFMLNANGFITNDIMQFEQCQSDSVARSVLERMKVLHPESYPQDMSVDEMMSACVPANYGSPAEFVSSQKFTMERLYNLQKSAIAKKLDADLQKEQDIKELLEVEKRRNELDGSIPSNE